jgi:hypothetical protein
MNQAGSTRRGRPAAEEDALNLSRVEMNSTHSKIKGQG